MIRRFRWYFLDESTEGVCFSNGHVAHDIDDWKGTYHYCSWEEFVQQHAPEHIEWIDFEGVAFWQRLAQGVHGAWHWIRTKAWRVRYRVWR